MKDLKGAATRVVQAPLEQCLAVLEDVERYPDWYPEVVRYVNVLERDPDGRATRVRTQLHVARGPIVKDFDLVLAVNVEPRGTVELTKVDDGSSEQRFDVIWHVAEGTRIELRLHATLNVPGFMPLGGIGDGLAQGFVDAASRAVAAPPP